MHDEKEDAAPAAAQASESPNPGEELHLPYEAPAEAADKELLSSYEQSAKIASSILKESKQLVMPGASLLDIAETIEKMISDAGAKPAFPVNVSVNENAAHFTPEADCQLLLGERDLVKVDFGVHINGCIADAAYTIDLSGENGKQLEAAENALLAAISAIRPGKRTGEIGKAIEGEIKKLGYKPIENLTGHMLKPYMLHGGPEIPNISREGGYEFEEGDFFAIEPFASTGKGSVHETDQVEIFQVLHSANTRLRTSKQVLSFAAENYLTLPFAQRWLAKKFPSKLLLSAALKELLNLGIFYPFPMLADEKGSLVSQAENTVVVEKDGARPLVKA